MSGLVMAIRPGETAVLPLRLPGAAAGPGDVRAEAASSARRRAWSAR